MDFIEHLPSSSGHTAILVVVDRLSKQGIFIPTTDDITAPKPARLFIIHVFSKHGVPTHVTCDQGSEFVSHFFRSLGSALNMKIHFTLGYHPEGDGQTERLNQTNNTSTAPATTNKIIGRKSFPSPNSPTTIPPVLLLA